MSYGATPYGQTPYGGEDAPYAPSGTPSVLPMRLSGFLTSVASTVPMRLSGLTPAAAGSLSMRLEAPDPAHYRAASARWNIIGGSVILGGVDVSDQVVGRITIEHEENASGLCTLDLLPNTGAVDLDTYERQSLVVTFVGQDAAGNTLYTSRRFTGVTTTASYDPDSGVLSVEATTDLQGRLENLDRATIDNLLPGTLWSEHVFDDDADGWQYAQDRLSTLPSEIHVDNFGHLVLVPWAAKGTADVTLTDSERFNDSLQYSRATRRDLVARVNITFDFRYVRLRHREISVKFYTSSFCDWANTGWTLPSKEMVRSAADGSEWTRTSDILFTALPGPGTYCTPARGWSGGADEFCLGAQWKAARRWAQTVTEVYTLNVIASDIEDAIGQQQLVEDYGVEATYDGTDYEQVKDFDAAPSGAVLLPATDDWTKEATDSEADGRVAMEAAQECALARARTEILRRARLNRLRLSAVFDPTLTMAHTVRVEAAHLTAQGKVFGIRDVLDLDTGDLQQDITLAISRHGGSGLASDTPLVAATAPATPAETSTGRSYAVGIRIGGKTNAPVDNEDWDGYMTNVAEVLRDPTAPVYRERLRLAMPAIEDTARNATELGTTTDYEVEVPNDTLTMSY